MRSYALVEAGDSETIDLFLSVEEAQRALKGCLRDEPEWLINGSDRSENAA
jgi:hypothetical protein